ncbi:MAG: hypothetical protein HY906_14600 [Deltaproteobacteria bacterium]|nr:hypothetical protein [Deltaproteobacteria bacterium]
MLAPRVARREVGGDEHDLRARLGIPAKAQRIIVLGETSHWDPNWLHTSEGYYERRIRHILDAVIDALQAEPRRVYSIECLFFLKLYWERVPERREALRELLASGRLQLTGTGLTTPDTVLPEAESILRDYLIGQEWLRAEGIHVEPRLAYLPDDFGHSPALPTMLRALGMDRAAVTRIDGMYFVAADYRLKGAFPLKGSSAATLQQELGTLDFVWRAPDGAEVLCHWNAFSYFQGDLLAHKGIVRWMDLEVAVSWRSTRHLAGRIREFTKQLAPLAPTPYVFCPIGMDFVGPIPHLTELLDRYNRKCADDTGIYAVNAGLDDYLDLVDCHRSKLPVVDLDPNPYWMGFYASRPEIKRSCNRIARAVDTVEKLQILAGRADASVTTALRETWELLALSNHHDFITGTSPDSTYEAEQRPWLDRAELLAAGALARAVTEAPPAPPAAAATPPQWSLAGRRLEVATPHYRLRLDEGAGGCVTSFVVDGEEYLAGPANDLVAYRDTGGLWRLGHEYRGGKFRAVDQASHHRARIRAGERDGLLEVRVDSALGGRPFTRWLWLRADSPAVRMRIEGAAAPRLTVTCRFPLATTADSLTMDVPGGVLRRAAYKLYAPTFWPARSFAHVQDPKTRRGVAAFLGGPAAVALTDGGLEWIAARNATKEQAFGFLPILCHPIGGTCHGRQVLDYAVWCTPAGGHLENRLPRLARQVLRDSWLTPGVPDPEALADTVVRSDRADVLVGAVKPASRGTGVVARLERFSRHATHVRLRAARPILAAWLCDARERDLRGLQVADGRVEVPLALGLTSVRLLLG